jgi:3-hydroxyacyl-[acyl-carrier-protein] dehydratase
MKYHEDATGNLSCRETPGQKRMKKNWNAIKNLKVAESGEITAEATFDADSPWFDGHFPGFPILPGIAELGLVSDSIRKAGKASGKNIFISQIRKVRFRQFIRPNDSVRVLSTTDKQDPTQYKFKLMVNGQLACNGVIETVEADDTLCGGQQC